MFANLIIMAPLKGINMIDLSDRFLREKISIEGYGDNSAGVGALLDVLAACLLQEGGMDTMTSFNLETPGAAGLFIVR